MDKWKNAQRQSPSKSLLTAERVRWFVAIGLFTLVIAAMYTPAFASEKAEAPTLALNALGKGTATLNGPWQFHLGDDPAWASPALDDATGHSGWEQLTAEKPWGAQGHPAYVGFAWYRRHLHLSPAPGASPEFALLNQRIEDVYEIYWNGKLIVRHGEMPPNPSFRYGEGQQTISLGQARDGVLAVRVWKQPLVSFDSGEQGGFTAPPEVGSPEAIAADLATSEYKWLHSRQYAFGETMFTALIALLSLIGWLRNRDQRVLLWMAVFSGSWVTSAVLVGMRLPFSFNFALGTLQPVLGLRDIALWFLLIELLQLKDNQRLVRFTWALAIVTIVSTSLDGLLSAVTMSYAEQVADGVLTVIFTVAELYAPVLVIMGLRCRPDHARVMVATFAFLSQMIFVVRIALSQGSRFTHWKLADKIDLPLFTIDGNSFNLSTIFRLLLLLSVVYAVFRHAREEFRRQHAVEQDLLGAQELQRVLIPDALPSLPGFSLTSAYRPAQEVGGDFFQIIPVDDSTGSTLVVLGDVSGKGLRAAMAVSLIVGAARTLADFTSNPAEILAGLNRRLYGRLKGGFVTCLVLRLDPDGTCVVANAGHPAPFLNHEEIASPGMLPLGVTAHAVYEETRVQLEAGDHFVLYTDGLLEARTPAGELFGFERLRALFTGHPNAEQATEVAVNFGQQDDITVLTLTRLAVGEEASTQLTAPAA